MASVASMSEMATSFVRPTTRLGPCRGLKPVGIPSLPTRAGRRYRMVTRMAASSIAADEVPDMGKRVTMNLLVLGAASLPVLAMAGPYLYFFVPKGAGAGVTTQAAKDALGNDIKASEWVKTHLPGDKSLSQGLKGDPTYLIVNEGGTIENFGLNAVCTHLGCVVPWIAAENKFKCPCHGSQYDVKGSVTRGPAPLPLALAHAEIDAEDTVNFRPWTETDFRSNTAPWWS